MMLEQNFIKIKACIANNNMVYFVYRNSLFLKWKLTVPI